MELNIKGEYMNEKMMKDLHNLCDFNPKYYNFPGSLPVSLSKNDLKFLKRNYTVCDKTDGSRYFLFGFDKNMYFVDRLMNVYYLGKTEYNNFVYDGELVNNKYNDNKWYYVIFDVFCHLCVLLNIPLIEPRLLLGRPRNYFTSSSAQLHVLRLREHSTKNELISISTRFTTIL